MREQQLFQISIASLLRGSRAQDSGDLLLMHLVPVSSLTQNSHYPSRHRFILVSGTSNAILVQPDISVAAPCALVLANIRLSLTLELPASSCGSRLLSVAQR